MKIKRYITRDEDCPDDLIGIWTKKPKKYVDEKFYTTYGKPLGEYKGLILLKSRDFKALFGYLPLKKSCELKIIEINII